MSSPHKRQLEAGCISGLFCQVLLAKVQFLQLTLTTKNGMDKKFKLFSFVFLLFISQLGFCSLYSMKKLSTGS